MKLKIYTDGGSRGNPGPAAAAFVVYEVESEGGPSTRYARSGSSVSPAEKLREKRGKYLGVKTNNEAEYQGVIEALGYLRDLGDLGGPEEVFFYLDSSLVVNQLNGKFKVKEARLRDLLIEVRGREQALSPVPISYQHVPREKNWEADEQVNLTLDGQNG